MAMPVVVVVLVMVVVVVVVRADSERVVVMFVALAQDCARGIAEVGHAAHGTDRRVLETTARDGLTIEKEVSVALGGFSPLD